MTNKLIKNLDQKTWNQFAGLCKIQGVLIGDKINLLIAKEIKKSGVILLK